MSPARSLWVQLPSTARSSDHDGRAIGWQGASWRALGATVPADPLLRRIDLGELREALSAHYSVKGRSSIAPDLLRMALIARRYAITSGRRLCEEVRFNLAYRWFCRLPLGARMPGHFNVSGCTMSQKVTPTKAQIAPIDNGT